MKTLMKKIEIERSFLDEEKTVVYEMYSHPTFYFIKIWTPGNEYPTVHTGKLAYIQSLWKEKTK